MSKGRKPPKKKQQPQPLPSQPIPEPEKPSWWKRTFDKGWKKFLGLVAIVAFITSCFAIYDRWFKSDKEKDAEEKTYRGNLNPPPIAHTYKSTTTSIENQRLFLRDSFSFYEKYTDKNQPKIIGINMQGATSLPNIFIEFGKDEFIIPTIEFYKGVDLMDALDSFHKKCSNTQLVLGIKNDRLYVSTEFKSLQSKQTLGSIRFNHWKVYREQALEYPKQNDTMLEVQDKQSKIAFAIKYGQADVSPGEDPIKGVIIRGYFLGDTSIAIANNSIEPETNCISESEPNWEQKAAVLISEIKSIFPE